jgi:hypothetical protein
MIESIEKTIQRKQKLISIIQDEVRDLEFLRKEVEKKQDDEHFENPEPGDFWHDCFSPVLIVLEATENGIVVCDKIRDVYEPPREDMVLRSYESPDDPEVKRYFSLPRKCTGYTFDIEQAKKISKDEFSGILKAYSGEMKNKLTYKCVPGRAKEFSDLWIARKTKI